MDEEIRIPVSLPPPDSDGFLRRECPSCEREFKWFSHNEGDPNAEPATQYFCPLCTLARLASTRGGHRRNSSTATAAQEVP